MLRALFLGAALGFEIRAACATDVVHLVAMWQDLIKQTPHLFSRTRCNRANRRAVAHHFATIADHGQVLVGALDGCLVGYLAIVAHLPPLEEKWSSATISDLYVLPAYRGRGIGRGLLEAALVLVRARGLDGVSLQVDPHNVAAVSLYRRLGFECVAWSMALRFGHADAAGCAPAVVGGL